MWGREARWQLVPSWSQPWPASPLPPCLLGFKNLYFPRKPFTALSSMGFQGPDSGDDRPVSALFPCSTVSWSLFSFFPVSHLLYYPSILKKYIYINATAFIPTPRAALSTFISPAHRTCVSHSRGRRRWGGVSVLQPEARPETPRAPRAASGARAHRPPPPEHARWAQRSRRGEAPGIECVTPGSQRLPSRMDCAIYFHS